MITQLSTDPRNLRSRQRYSLDGHAVQIDLQWLPRNGAWHADVAVDGVLLCTGRRLSVGCETLIPQAADSPLQGVLVVYGVDEGIMPQGLGASFFIRYVS